MNFPDNRKPSDDSDDPPLKPQLPSESFRESVAEVGEDKDPGDPPEE